MRKHHRDPRKMDRFWLRHTASVPKGFLRFEVMRLLQEKSMSGAELMTEIEKQTEERWKPSPGSMYPLLSWLVDNGYIAPLARQENGQKRYKITTNGETFLKELTEKQEKLEERLHAYGPPGFPGFGRFPFPRFQKKLMKPMGRVFEAIRGFRHLFRTDLSDQEVETLSNFLDKIADQITETAAKLRKKKIDKEE
ncbi:MAG: PadR family transcriptional regulator [Candidatus Ranarchaeia archaeon]|jgi:DNA-binding PadR family transcriptional regulator